MLSAALTAISLGGLFGAAVALANPEYTFPPKVTGKAQHVGQALECFGGDWRNPGRTFAYQWVIEGDELGFHEGTSADTLKLIAAYEHKEIWCEVSTTNGATVIAPSENSVCFVAPCGVVAQEAPMNTALPAVTGGSGGEAKVGETLTCTQGSWTGTAPIAYAYKWFREKEAISGATSSQHTVVAEDETHKLSCRVTASNGGGELTKESSNSVLVVGTPPKNFELPSVLGVDAVNETLTCDPGGWSGSPPITYEYRWFRNGTELAMETGPTYIVKGSDEGQKLRCKVIAKNSLGKAEATSGEVMINGTLKNVEPPILTPPREAKVGTRIKCSQGTWNESASELMFEYQWVRDEDEPIEGQTTSEYVVASGDAKHELQCRVFVTNAKKEKAKAISLPDSVPGPGAPKKLTSPEVQGSPELGATLKCYEGTWSGSPTSYKFQWVREGVSLGATEQSYVVKPADEGHSLACLVVAVNSEGPSEQVESPSVVVAGEAPSPVRGPEIEGGTPTPRVGESLTCLHGEWKGAPAPTFTYEWYRDGSERLAATIAYTIASADRGHSLSCVVTAKNSEAPPEGVSDSSGLLAVPGIAPEPPLSGPQVEGTPAVEQTLTCKEGAWTGQPAPEYSFEWVVNGSPVPSATTNKFKIGTADSGYNIACRVTGTNNTGSASALSRSVHIPGKGPETLVQPSIKGSASVGAQLTCERGVWAGKPPPTFTYQWYRGSSPIAGATEETYVVETADMGYALSCNVLGANSEGSVEQESTNLVVIASHTSTGPGGGSTSTGPGTTKTTVPNAAEILATIKRQVISALSESHLKKIARAGSFSFGFIAPGAGAFEVEWYEVDPVNGKSKDIVLGKARVTYTKVSRQTIKLKLDAAGRSLLKGRRSVKLHVKGLFALRGHRAVVWTGTVVLHA